MSELKVDTISENTSAGGVTVESVLVKDGSVKGNGTGRKNVIINGDFDIWQRGTSFTGSKYTADRWDVVVSGTGTTTTTQQAFTLGQTDVPNEPKYYLRIAKSSGVSGASGGDVLTQKVESVRTFAGQTATLSFYAKASESTTIDFFLKQHFGTGGSPSADVDQTPTGVSVTTSWQKFTVTQAFPSISGKTIGSNNDDYLELIMRIDNGSDASVDFAQIQWEKGSVATDFEKRNIGEELALCQRYFTVLINGLEEIATSAAYSGSVILGAVQFPTSMRDDPTISQVTGTNYIVFWRNNGSYYFNGWTHFYGIGTRSTRVQFNGGSNHSTQGHGGVTAGANASYRLYADAEL